MTDLDAAIEEFASKISEGADHRHDCAGNARRFPPKPQQARTPNRMQYNAEAEMEYDTETEAAPAAATWRLRNWYRVGAVPIL
ncbi:MAG: hypothetical protein V9H26_05645 [Verrucomicrobiota bacterium]